VTTTAPGDGPAITATAPGRVNLTGDHTDTTGGLVLPMAVHLATTVSGRRGGDHVSLRSADEPEPAVVPLDVTDPAGLAPDWARYVAGVVSELAPTVGFTGEVVTTLPVGAGLSSSAALEVAVALALGFEGRPLDLARLAQRAEQRASGVPCGIMDQLASAAGRSGHALLIDCHALTIEPVPLPEGIEVRVVHSGESRRLAGSAYGERQAALQAAEEVVGPLRRIADLAELDRLDDPVLTRRARHVVTENARVRTVAAALRAGDLATAGEAMAAGHASLRDDFEVSTPALDALVDRLGAITGVHGVRLTGAGFGGCVVALTEPDALAEGWAVHASDGARVSNDPTGDRRDHPPRLW
jgi:galactokinase